MNPFRRTFQWVFVKKGQPLPRGKIVWAEPHGMGGLEGGIKVCVVRRG